MPFSGAAAIKPLIILYGVKQFSRVKQNMAKVCLKGGKVA